MLAIVGVSPTRGKVSHARHVSLLQCVQSLRRLAVAFLREIVSYGLKSFAHDLVTWKLPPPSSDSMPYYWRMYSWITSSVILPLDATKQPRAHKTQPQYALSKSKNLKVSPEGEESATTGGAGSIPRNPSPSQIRARTAGAFSPVPPVNTKVSNRTCTRAPAPQRIDPFDKDS